ILIKPVRGFKSIPTAYATIKGFEVMRALRKGQARPWCLQPGIRGEVRLVERAFGIGPSALTEAMGMLNHHFAAAACSAQSDSLPLTAANLCTRARGGPSMNKAITTCAVTGNITSRAQHPGLPVTPTEIAEASLQAAEAGAAIIHIHVRDPQSGEGSMELDLYREVVGLIRAQNTAVILNLTTGPGGRFIPGDPEPRVGSEQSTL